MKLNLWDMILILCSIIVCMYVIITDRAKYGRHEYKRGMQEMSKALYDLKTMNVWKH